MRRKQLCSLCTSTFRTKGTTRVIRFVVLTFCMRCWTDHRGACESFAQGAAGPIPDSLPLPPPTKPKRTRGRRGGRGHR